MIFLITALIACSGGQVEETPTATVEQPAPAAEVQPVVAETPAESQTEDATVAPATESSQPAASTTTAAH